MFQRAWGAVVLALVAGGATAEVDPALLDSLRWRLLGPFRAGRVLTVAGVSSEPHHFYFGAVNGGVWETTNAGRTWRPIFDDQPIGSIGALAVAPSDPRVLYVGTGEADMRSDIAQGDGVYKSTDGGATWRHVGLGDSQQVGRVVVHPQNPDVVFVAALGHPYGPNAERGLFRSRDGGASWQKVLGKDDATGAIDVVLEPGNPQVVYAVLWQTRRTPWSIYPPANGPGGGVFKSTDGGDSWTRLNGRGLPAETWRVGLAIAPSRPQRVYALVDAVAGGLYRSDDAGATWTRTTDDGRLWVRGWYFAGVTVEPRDPDVVWACNTALYRSTDGGKSFVPVEGAPGGDDYHDLWIDPQHPERRIVGTDQGTIVSLDGGASWSSWYNQPTAQLYHVATDSRFPYWVYGAQQDAGAVGLPSRTTRRDGITQMDFRSVTAGGESDYVVPDPRDPEILYGGRVVRLDLRTGQTRSIDPIFAYPELYRGAWTLPLVFSRRDPRVLYAARQQVFRSEDGGERWVAISPDLTRVDPGVPANLDMVTAANHAPPGPRGVVYAIAPSRLADHDLWVGTDDGLVWRTRDEGKNWIDITPAGLGAWSKIGVLETSHFDAETAYAAVDRHRLDDGAPYIYRTHDGGRNWQLVARGIPTGSFVNAVREDPERAGLLYAGTEKGVYVSFDDGERWQPLRAGLPVTSVRDLDVHGEDLVIATHGRGFWVLDDVTPLRQLVAATAQDLPYLFAPATAIRLRPAGFTGTPMPKDEPLAANPPAGARIDYLLREPAKSVTLEIRDARGDLVRRFTSAEGPRQPNLAKLRTAPKWVAEPVVLTTSAGLHRFVWSLRHAAAAALVERGHPGDGVWAAPGRYEVVLDVDGRRLDQPLTVAPDPRLTLPAAAYEAELALARRIESSRARLATAEGQVEALIDDLASRRPQAQDELGRAIDALSARALELWGRTRSSAGQELWWLPPRSTDSLRFLADALEELAYAVDGADAAPAPDAAAGVAALEPAVTATLAAWEKLRAEALNLRSPHRNGP